jgi:hypothetical protein
MATWDENDFFITYLATFDVDHGEMVLYCAWSQKAANVTAENFEI